VLDVRPGVLQQLLDGQCLPVVCSLAADDQGQVYNVNADTIAAGIAVALRAAKYFLVTAVDGVLRNLSDSTTLLPYLDLTDLDQLTSSGAISGGMLPKLAGCRTALLGGVPRVHIVNGRVADTLLAEIFTNAGCGTLIVRQKDRSADEPSEEPRGASVCT
jgi:acetylglutamate kinase